VTVLPHSAHVSANSASKSRRPFDARQKPSVVVLDTSCIEYLREPRRDIAVTDECVTAEVVVRGRENALDRFGFKKGFTDGFEPVGSTVNSRRTGTPS